MVYMNSFAVYLIVLLFNISALSAKAIHLFVAGDIHDKEIRYSVEKDCEDVIKSFSYIADLCDVPIHVTKITTSRHKLTYNRLSRHIKKAHISKRDVIVFYFSGHGKRDQHTRLIWPSMRFSNEHFVDSTLIIEKLFRKRAALTLVLIDCCNRDSIMTRGTENISSLKPLPQKDTQLKKNCRELFFNSCGIVIASAAQPGELANCWTAGGFFTNSSLNILFRRLQSPSPQWESIVDEIKKSCHAENDEVKNEQLKNQPDRPPLSLQTPQYALLLGKKMKKVREYIHHIRHLCLYRKETQNPDPEDVSFDDPRDDPSFDESIYGLVKFKMEIEPRE